MTNFENKLQNIYENLLAIVPQLKKICVNKIKDIPVQIDRIVIGQNKLKAYTDPSIGEYEVNEDDLKDVRVIPFRAFNRCTNLTRITIPDSVRNINLAFQGCSGLTDIYMRPITPPTLSDTDIPTTTIIHVPVGSGDAYKNATNWSSFADKIVEDIEI